MSDEDTFKIILSTDNHLGFLEKDLVRGDDSFISFEEVLSISKKSNPDFVLLGGDLFHENKPSISTLFKCTELIRKYCYNSNPLSFRIVSDQGENFSHSECFKHTNFNDSNINVGLPIFTIHGNHDDQIDQTNLCALDLFHAAGLVNLFGKFDSVESVEISPILMQKGCTKLAIYGLGAMKNERLHRLFLQNKVKFLRPEESTDQWFSIFVLHQNRVKHGPTNYIPETFLPQFIDLIIWGHEHDCRIDPEWNTTNEFYISQPGSSVATSLCEGEALEKSIGILEIRERQFKLSKVKLETIRPFVLENVVLDEQENLNPNDPQVGKVIETMCHMKVQEMLLDSENLKTENENQPKLPLLRLIVDYSGGFEMFSIMRFCHDYVDKVANPKDMLVLHRRKEQMNRQKIDDSNVVISVKAGSHSKSNSNVGLDHARVEDMVHQYFQQVDDKMRLCLLSETELGGGVRLCVDKDNDRVFGRVVDWQLDKAQDYLKEIKPAENSIVDEIKKAVNKISLSSDENDAVLRQKLMEEIVNDDLKSSTSNNVSETLSIRGSKSSTRARGSTRGRGRGGTKRKAKANVFDEDNMSIESSQSSNSVNNLKHTTSQQNSSRGRLRKKESVVKAEWIDLMEDDNDDNIKMEESDDDLYNPDHEYAKDRRGGRSKRRRTGYAL